MENNVLDLSLALRKIHQDYVSILYEDISKRSAGIETTQEQFPSDYLGWLRDRNPQNEGAQSENIGGHRKTD